MADVAHANPATPALPSLNALLKAGTCVKIAIDSGRLHWILDVPLSSAIKVKSLSNVISPQPCFDSSSGTWHELSAEPSTASKVSSIQVSIAALSDWDEAWEDHHWTHDNAEFRIDEGREALYDSAVDPRYIVRCCGQDRLEKMPTLLVTPLDTNRGYVTVHDFVSTVHPWLMERRDDIVAALSLRSLPVGPAHDFRVDAERGSLIEVFDPAVCRPMNEEAALKFLRVHGGSW